MARDNKLIFTFEAVSAADSTLAVSNVTTPSGDKTNSSAQIGTIVTGGASLNQGSKAIALGIRNSTQNVTSFSEWIAGNEISAVANDPAIWGNTSFAEMTGRGVWSWNVPTAASANLAAKGNPSLTVQGAFDSGTGTPAAASWQNISAAFPLLEVVPATITTVTAASPTVATVTAGHGLVTGDYITLPSVGTIGSNVVVDRIYRVGTFSSANVFTLLLSDGNNTSTPTGTLTGLSLPIYKLRNFNSVSGKNGGFFNVPMVMSLRPWVRIGLSYSTAATSGTVTVTLSKTGLTTGRENSTTF